PIQDLTLSREPGRSEQTRHCRSTVRSRMPALSRMLRWRDMAGALIAKGVLKRPTVMGPSRESRSTMALRTGSARALKITVGSGLAEMWDIGPSGALAVMELGFLKSTFCNGGAGGPRAICGERSGKRSWPSLRKEL